MNWMKQQKNLNTISKKKFLSPINEKEIKDFKITSNDIVLNIVFDKILDHFEKNINFYRNYCLKIKKILNINNITKIFWGMPPANPDLRLALISYLKANNIKTIGVQLVDVMEIKTMTQFKYLLII